VSSAYQAAGASIHCTVEVNLMTLPTSEVQVAAWVIPDVVLHAPVGGRQAMTVRSPWDGPQVAALPATTLFVGVGESGIRFEEEMWLGPQVVLAFCHMGGPGEDLRDVVAFDGLDERLVVVVHVRGARADLDGVVGQRSTA